MKCSNCGMEIENDSLFCPYCGEKAGQSVPAQNSGGNYCPSCGMYNDADSAFCEGCGTDLLNLDTYKDTPVKKKTTRNVIIAIVIVLVLAIVGGGVYFAITSALANIEAEQERERKKEEREKEKKSSNKDEREERVSEVDEEDQRAADEVIDYIDDIGKVTLASGAAIEKARDEYDQLTSDQKALVTNYSDLTAAEDAYQELKDEKEDSSYVIADSDRRIVTSSELSSLSLKELGYARNEIFARHGRLFKSQELQTYFNSKSWYNGTISADSFNTNVLNETERKNIELIKAEEERRGGIYPFS